MRHAERVMESLERKPRAIAEELLLRLAATDGSALSWEEDELCLAVASATMRAPRSSRAPRDEAAHVAHVARVHDVLDQLKAELVVRRAVAGDGAGDGSGHGVEIGHEALLKDWPRLASARLAEMDRLLALERVREAARRLERADNHKDALMQGAPLADARARRALLDRGLSAVDRSFLEASFSRAKLRRAVRAVAIVVATSFLAAGGMSKRMLDEAREDELRAKAAAVESSSTGRSRRRLAEPTIRIPARPSSRRRSSAEAPTRCSRSTSTRPRRTWRAPTS